MPIFCRFIRKHLRLILLPLVITAGCGTVSTTTITSFTPTLGAVGATVTITGTNFSTTAASNTVTFNGTAATVTSSTSTSIVTTVPDGATTGPIKVTVSSSSATSSADFTVIPSITTFLPASGSVGTTVVLTGTGFDATLANNVVKFNGVKATISSASSTALIVTVPSGATTGNITVTVNGVSAITATTFTVS